jgi:hypothetical protein
MTKGDETSKLVMNDIEALLHHPDRNVREAAVDAIVQVHICVRAHVCASLPDRMCALSLYCAVSVLRNAATLLAALRKTDTAQCSRDAAWPNFLAATCQVAKCQEFELKPGFDRCGCETGVEERRQARAGVPRDLLCRSGLDGSTRGTGSVGTAAG